MPPETAVTDDGRHPWVSASVHEAVNAPVADAATSFRSRVVPTTTVSETPVIAGKPRPLTVSGDVAVTVRRTCGLAAPQAAGAIAARSSAANMTRMPS